jgi:formylglycine-generating enzyme required for sulfatase activity
MGEDGEQHPVRLGPFNLARYPVTNAQFRRFAEKDYTDDAYWTPQGIEWRNKATQRHGLVNDPQWGIDNRPAVGLTWHEAVAYARWLARKTGRPFRLPTEAEWERAAAGTDGRKYPWGNRTSDDTTNTREAAIGQTTAVGIFPGDKTPEGIYDLGGNVWEWTGSLDRAYPYKAADGREAVGAAGQRILRGGAYDTLRKFAHCSQRRPADPSTRAALIGFRVAMDG